MEDVIECQKENTPFGISFVAGAVAGLAVDVSLFPFDTIKTRLQSSQGFLKSGGCRGIYSGLASVTVASAPAAGLFFCTYELTKAALTGKLINNLEPVAHMTAASLGEVVACVVRVPCEVVKQRTQVTRCQSSLSILKKTLQTEGPRGLYRGYFSTVLREVPFSLIQFPLWEFFKKRWSVYQMLNVTPWQSAICGSAAGSMAAVVTTPLDVAKTRIMLANTGTSLARGSIFLSLKVIWHEKGIKGLFAGVVPRTLWIAIGGAIFLGAYDKTKDVLTRQRVKIVV